jgi:assimilatory nitrate reductase catalytic subunit
LHFLHESVDTAELYAYRATQPTASRLDHVHTLAPTATPTATHCPYCAFQCGIRLSGPVGGLEVEGDPDFPVSRGALCIKGFTSTETLDHPDRLRTPLIRNAQGTLLPASWDDALGRVAEGIRATQERHGADAMGVFGGGSLTNEKAYLLGKFARAVLGTRHIDYNGRFCMSSAAGAAIRALGVDRGLPFPVDEIARADAILLVGANPAETMPPLMQYFQAQRAAGGALIVADPRRTLTAQGASLHLRLTPGSDAALANGLLHLLLREGAIDRAFIDARTEGFDAVRGVVATYWPERVERITGVPEAQLVETARRLGAARRPMVLTARGAEQQAQGVANVLAYIDLALALGRHGEPFTGFGTVTGQGNGQGGREHGQKADQLPGYRRLDDPAARAHLAAMWDMAAEEIPGPGASAYEMLDRMGRDGGVRALFVMGSNPVVSAPRARHVERRLRALDLLVVTDFFLSETARLADVVLPSAQWAEEDGTMTNLEGRVILRRRAAEPPPEVRTDLEILVALAARLGRARRLASAEAATVFDELRRATAGGVADYAGITYERLSAGEALFWPCPSVEHPGSPYVFAERFATPSGRARFVPVRHGEPAEEPDEEFPLYLTTGRVMSQYQSGTQTRRVERLARLAPEPTVEMHPAAAQRARIADGALVTLASRRGTAVARARLTREIREDTVFVAFHWGGAGSINRLTNPALDPSSRMPEFKVCAVRVEPHADSHGAMTA